MDSHLTKTPYNSLYEPLNNYSSKSEHKVCCLHGKPCSAGGKSNNHQVESSESVKIDENQYVNLTAPTAEQQMAESLAKKLTKLAIDERLVNKNKTEFESLETVMRETDKIRNCRKTEAIEDRENYVNLNKRFSSTRSSPMLNNHPSDPMKTTMSSLPTDSSFSLTTGVAKESESSRSSSKKKIYKSYAAAIYIGALSPSDAEKQVTEPATFCLYHEYYKGSLNKLTDGLPLIIVYKATDGSYRHYPVRTTPGGNGDVQYFVDYGVANVRKHWSLNQLVKFYQIHASLHPNKNESADVFSYWNE
ncbi:unnamed protein product [Caenorhabditis bovis]|uniref:SH2 domain-containing protein n=1 Tax=Caenorhabditis bovis TaxID=2654633 RepID=A0A8S1EXX1_9PELO|nr:unnamed protein product [Caenorhabditis bovis]